MTVSLNGPDTPIARAVAFLRAQQLPHGEFVTLLGNNRAFDTTAFDSSVFATSFVVGALAQLDDVAADGLIARAIRFLRSEMEFGGVWRYWSTRQHKHARLPPDLDDTACISHALKITGRRVPNNIWIFLESRDAQGRFRTWILPTSRNCTDLGFLAARAVGALQAAARRAGVKLPNWEDPRFRVMHINRDDVDPVVNANVLLYLGESEATEKALEFVIGSVSGDGPSSLYYEDALALPYMVSRAYRYACPSLYVVREAVVERTRARVGDPDSLSPLQAAMAASILRNFDEASGALEPLVQRILETQGNDGGWPAYPFYNVWGSRELTTAFCIEALAGRPDDGYRCEQRDRGVEPGVGGDTGDSLTA